MLFEVRQSIRSLRRDPGFSVVAVVTLALGLAGSIAIFSFVNAILLRPLPFPQSDRLVLLIGSNASIGWPEAPTSYPYFDQWKSKTKSFDTIAAWTSFTSTRFNLTEGGEPESLQYAFATADLFPTLGVAPAIGRGFLPDEDRPEGARVALMSHGLWARRFGGDPAIVGRTLTLDGGAYTVIGVLPAGFRFLTFPAEPDLWVPLGLDPNGGRRFSPGTRYLGVIARLKPGVTVQQAKAEMDTIAARQVREFSDVGAGWSVRTVSLQEQAAGGLRRGLLILLGAIGFVFLIACANVANLLLARAVARGREFALRAALGASRGRLALRMLLDSLVLAAVSGILGLLLALWGIDLLARIPIQSGGYMTPFVVSQDSVGIDARVAAVAILLTLLAAAAAGLAPALRSSKVDLALTLKATGAGSTGGAGGLRLRSVLVVAEIALSLVLLVGAGLMARTFLHLAAIDPGLRPEGVITADISLPRGRYGDPEAIAGFYQKLLNRLPTLPSVQGAAAISALPMSGTDESTSLYVEGHAVATTSEMPQAHERTISPDCFKTMGVPVRSGRPFSAADGAQGARVAMVNETMARKLWPGENPIGRRVALDYDAMRGTPGKPPELDLEAGWREVVGVVGDVRHNGPQEEPRPELYVPYLQAPDRDMTIVVRTASDPASLAEVIRREVMAIDRGQPLTRVRTMQALVAQVMAKPRFSLILLGVFAGTAVLLALVGIYGVIAHSVGQRRREIGIRVALGARSGQVIAMVLRQWFRLVLAGVVIGLAAALALTRLMASLLYGVRPTDPLTFAAVAAVLVAMSLLASWVPAWRAMRVDPMIALRSE